MADVIKKPNCRVIIKDFEHLEGNKWKLWCTDIDELSPCEFVLSFCRDDIHDKLNDALMWRKVIRLCDMYKW